MANNQTVTGASGGVYTAQTKSIKKLSDLPVSTEYQVIRQEPTPTKDGSYVATNKVDDKSFEFTCQDT